MRTSQGDFSRVRPAVPDLQRISENAATRPGAICVVARGSKTRITGFRFDRVMSSGLYAGDGRWFITAVESGVGPLLLSGDASYGWRSLSLDIGRDAPAAIRAAALWQWWQSVGCPKWKTAKEVRDAIRPFRVERYDAPEQAQDVA